MQETLFLFESLGALAASLLFGLSALASESSQTK